MGGRGSSSGRGAKGGGTQKQNGKYGFGVTPNGKSYVSADKALYEGEPLEITRIHDKRLPSIFYQKASALVATSDGNGRVILKYADAVEYSEKNAYTTDMRYEIKTGFTVTDGGYVKSTGIDFDKVTEISGKTYGIGSLVKQHGFRWDRDRKVWKKVS